MWSQLAAKVSPERRHHPVGFKWTRCVNCHPPPTSAPWSVPLAEDGHCPLGTDGAALPPHLQTDHTLAGFQLPLIETPRLFLRVLHSNVDGGVEALCLGLDRNAHRAVKPRPSEGAAEQPQGHGRGLRGFDPHRGDTDLRPSGVTHGASEMYPVSREAAMSAAFPQS